MMAPEKMEVDEEDVKPSNVESEEAVTKPKKKKKKKHRHKDKAKRRGNGVPSNNARDRRLLKALLEKLLTMVEAKDSNKFFAWPVTDQIAPGYSAIITRPMDFATMRNKLRTNGYSSLKEFKNDFELLCNNAQTYNQSSTVYHKAARKLHHFGRKLMHTSKLLALKEDCPELAELTWEDLARDFQDVPVDSSAAPSGKEKALDEDTDPARILEKAQQALKGVGTQLALRKAETTLSFLRQRGDGSTSLNIVVPPSKRTMEMEKTVTLGSAVGKLSHGTGTIQGFKEDRRNQAKIGKSLNYGPFSSHAPVYDTYFANVNANEGSMMLSAVYGSETSAHYADSLRRFCADSEYCLNVANDVLDVLTGGTHSEARMVVAVGEDGLTKVVEKKSAKEASGQQEQEKKGEEEAKKVLYDFDVLRSLKDEGIDISFLDELENEEKEKSTLESKLSSAGILLKDLKQTQDTRLSLPPPQHLSLCSGPSQDELNLARDVVTTLTDISRQVPPRMIAPVEGLRRAMGIEHPARSSVVI